MYVCVGVGVGGWGGGGGRGGEVWQLHLEPSGFVMKCRQFFLNTAFVMNHECI